MNLDAHRRSVMPRFKSGHNTVGAFGAAAAVATILAATGPDRAALGRWARSRRDCSGVPLERMYQAAHGGHAAESARPEWGG